MMDTLTSRHLREQGQALMADLDQSPGNPQVVERARRFLRWALSLPELPAETRVHFEYALSLAKKN